MTTTNIDPVVEALPRRRDRGVTDRVVGSAESSNAPSTPPGTKKKSRLYFPAVDGLRGLAIASVLLYHTNWNTRGLFGVDVFFVVSGFLITFLLLRELNGKNTIALGSFYARRAKRLLPGMTITMFLVVLMVWRWGTLQELQSAADKSIFAVLQIANWHQLGAGEAYWDATGQVQPLAHMWSLSITEQFYLLWPLIMLGVWWISRRSAKVSAIALLGLAFASAWIAPLMWDGSNSDRLYLGTETRAVGFLAGGALASVVYWTVTRDRGHKVLRIKASSWSFVVTAMSTISLGIILTASVVTTSYHESWLYLGGIALVAFSAAIFTATLCSSANILTQFFSARPFVALGKVSYTVYLLHLPVYWLLQRFTGDLLPPLGLFIIGGTMTWGLATAMHYLITEKIRARPWNLKRGVAIMAASMVGVIVLGLVLPMQRENAMASGGVISDLHVVPGAAGGRPVVLTLGDSLAKDFATALGDYGTGAFAVVDRGVGGCGIASPEQVRATSGYVWEKQDYCRLWDTIWPDEIQKVQPDIILVHTSWDAADQLIDGAWTNALDESYRVRYVDQLEKILAWANELAPQSTVVFVNDRSANGIVTDSAQMGAFNSMLKRFTDSHPQAKLLDLQGYLCSGDKCATQDTNNDNLFLDDDVHFTRSGYAALAPWLESQLAAVRQ